MLLNLGAAEQVRQSLPSSSSPLAACWALPLPCPAFPSPAASCRHGHSCTSHTCSLLLLVTTLLLQGKAPDPLVWKYFASSASMPAGLHPNHSKFSRETTKATSCQSNLSCPHHSQRSTPLKSGLVLPLHLPASHLAAELWLQLNTALALVAFQLKKNT